MGCSGENIVNIDLPGSLEPHFKKSRCLFEYLSRDSEIHLFLRFP